MESHMESPIEPILYMYPNRYNWRRHRTFFKEKINCKKFLECLVNDNDNNNSNDNNNDNNNSNALNTIETKKKSQLYVKYTKKYYFISKLDKESLEYKKFISILSNNDNNNDNDNNNNDNEFICIKVGNDKLKNEYEISKTLQSLNIPVFMNYHCILECRDNLCIDNETRCLDVKRDLCGFEPKDVRYAIDFPDEIDVPVNIIVMPYIKYGEIGLHAWSPETFYILKNCLKHMIMALLYAAYKLNFIHGLGWLENGGIHDGNLLLNKTDLKSISYGEFGELEIIDGYYPVINDYHNGGFIDYNKIKYGDGNGDGSNCDWMIYHDIKYIVNHITLARECNLPPLSFISFLDKLSTCYKYVNIETNKSKCITAKKISKEICDMLCHEIDIFEYDY
jgi:hypothetical protein